MDKYSKYLKDRQETRKVENILRANRKKNFVQRILNPDKYPVIPNYQGSGKSASHQMSWGEGETKRGYKFRVYPNIVYDKKTRKLTDLGDKAQAYAEKTGEAIEFDTPKEATWFSKKYKSVWKKK